MNNRRGIWFKALCIILSLLVLGADVAFCADEVKAGSPVPSAPDTEAPAESKPVEAAGAEMPQAAVEPAQPQEEAPPAAQVDPGCITVNFKAADIRTVLAYISEVSAVDIVPAPEVKGIIDLKLTNKPWKTALDIIMRNYGLAYEREGDIIRVITVDKLKQEELATQAITINYGKAKEVVESIKQLLSARGKVTYDRRTNMALVTDIPTNIYKIGEVISRLDKQTPQVLIEARVIETTLGDNEKLGIDWNVVVTASGAKRPTTFPFYYYNTVNFPALDKFLPLVQTGNLVVAASATGGGQTTVTTPGAYPPTNGGPDDPNNAKGFPFVDYSKAQFADTFKFGTLDFSQFKAVLELIERRGSADIISNPRIVTVNNNQAQINVGRTFNWPKFERNVQTGKMEITGYEPMDLGTILKVTPRINSKGEIVMLLVPEISDYIGKEPLDREGNMYAPKFLVRKAATQVMVNDGDTIFIGGFIHEVTIDERTKMPFLGDMLGDVPYLGLLFSHKGIRKEKREMIFFITVNLATPGKVIQDVPVPEKAYRPVFSATQQGNNCPDKRSLKRQ